MPHIIHWILRLLPANPLCLRVVRNSSRRSRQLLVRGGFLGLLILLTLGMLLVTVSSGSMSLRVLASSGATIFNWVSTLQILLVCLLTPIFMAGAIAHESNPRTWNILLTTPLSSLQVVLGNLLGRWFFILVLLLSSLPLFMLLRFFGGVPGESIFGAFAIAAGSSLVVAAVAVTLSVSRVGGKRTVFAFYFGIILLLFLTYALDRSLRTPVPGDLAATWTTVMTPLNPFLALEVLLSSKTYLPHDTVDASWLARLWLGRPVATFVWITLISSTLLMFFSTLSVRILARNGNSESLLRRLVGLSPSGVLEREPRPVGRNAIAWRESHRGDGGWSGRLARWGFVGITMLALIALLWTHQTQTMQLHGLRDALIVLLLAEVCLVILISANMSATAVSKEREDGSLDIMLTTPIQPGPYLTGKHRGLIRYLLPMMLVPFASLVMTMLYISFGGFGTSVTSTITLDTGTTQDIPLLEWSTTIGFAIMFIPFMAFCVMIGLMWSIRSRGTISSMTVAVLLIAIIIAITTFITKLFMDDAAIMGPMAAGFSPISLIAAAIDPANNLKNAMESENADVGILMLIGCIIAAAVYSAGAVLLHRQMSRTFMMTVRQLAGTQ